MTHSRLDFNLGGDDRAVSGCLDTRPVGQDRLFRVGNKRNQLGWGVETGVLREEVSEETILK